jgi:hypothetical protein
MSRLLKMLEQFDDNITVGHVKRIIKSDIKEKDLEEEYSFDRVKEKYNNSYLKIIDADALFGRTLNVYHIEEITAKEKSTDWELYYRVRGKKLEFTEREVFELTMNGTDIHYSFSEMQLKEMTKISEKDFKDYVFECDRIKSKLAKIIE